MLFWLEFLNDQADNTEISEFYFLEKQTLKLRILALGWRKAGILNFRDFFLEKEILKLRILAFGWRKAGILNFREN